MRKIVTGYIHCSYSEWGDLATLRRWHTDPKPKGNGWSDVGYHFLIYNQFPKFSLFKKRATSVAEAKLGQRLYSSHTDGQIVTGRPLSIRGSHVRSNNYQSVGICYIGIEPTASQYNALLVLCSELIIVHGIKIANIRGHYEEDENKTCPNFDMDTFRKALRMRLAA